jgi:hypothetical protein
MNKTKEIAGYFVKYLIKREDSRFIRQQTDKIKVVKGENKQKNFPNCKFSGELGNYCRAY